MSLARIIGELPIGLGVVFVASFLPGRISALSFVVSYAPVGATSQGCPQPVRERLISQLLAAESRWRWQPCPFG